MFKVGDRVYFERFNVTVKVLKRFPSGNYWVQWFEPGQRFRATARPEELAEAEGGEGEACGD